MNPRRRAALHAFIAVCIAAALPQTLVAQVVHGTVIDSVSGRPISGAVVMVLDSPGGGVLASDISGESGEYRVSSSRARSIRVLRIGFQPFERSLADESDRSLDITLAPFSTALATIRVTDKSSVCPRSVERAAGFAYWGQARAALLNSVIARTANPMSVHRLYFSRALNAENGSTKTFVVSEDYSGSAKTSFTSLRSATDLVRKGFSGDSGVVGYIFGPDADMLADDAFAHGYCFRVAEPDKARPTQVGIAFSAPDFRRGRVDIDGTLWIDTVARTLRDVEFRYVGMPQIAEQFHPGGTISFSTGANGVVFIDRWSLHLVGNAPYPVYSPRCRRECDMRDSFYPMDNGAEVSHLDWRDGRHWDAHLGTVSIHATTAAVQPANGTMLELPGTPYGGTVDSKGELRLTDLLPGPYTVRVRDPRVSGLAFSLPTSLRFTSARDSIVQLSLDVPTVEDFIVSECKTNRNWNTTDSTYLLGRVMDGDKKPVADARVTFSVRDSTGTWSWDKETLKTDADGVFESCGTTLTRGAKLQVRVESDHSWTKTVSRDVKDKTTIVPVKIDAKP